MIIYITSSIFLLLITVVVILFYYYRVVSTGEPSSVIFDSVAFLKFCIKLIVLISRGRIATLPPGPSQVTYRGMLTRYGGYRKIKYPG